VADQDDSPEKIRLTQSNVQRLLENNDGFEASTNYSGKNFQESRHYRVSAGEVRVRSTGNTSWADSRFDKDFVADADQTRRFLRSNLDALNTEGVTRTGDRATHSSADPGENVEHQSSAGYEEFDSSAGYEEFDEHEDRTDPWDGVAEALGRAVAELAIAGVVIIAPHLPSFWRSKVKPAATNLRNRLTKQGPTDMDPDGGTTDDESA